MSKHRDDQERPIHVSKADADEHESVHSRDGSIHADDGSEQPRLDDMRKQPHGRSATPAANEPAREREVGQFTGEGQPSRQKK
jgi:hypothetical protein